jgi:hypothetical protein
MGKAKKAMRTAAKAGMMMMAAEGIAGAAMAGAARWAGRRMRDRGRNRAIRAAGHGMMLATAAMPAVMLFRRRMLG